MDDITPKKSIDYTPTLGDGNPPPSPTSEMLWAERIRASIEEIASEEAANAAARRASSPEIAFEGRTPFPAVVNSEIEADDEVIVTFRKFFGDHKTMEFMGNRFLSKLLPRRLLASNVTCRRSLLPQTMSLRNQ